MRIFMAAAIAALLLDASGASAREFGDITRPYTEKYGDWKKTRKALRKMQKKDQPMSGDDWFLLAAMCNIEPPEGPSRTMWWSISSRPGWRARQRGFTRRPR